MFDDTIVKIFQVQWISYVIWNVLIALFVHYLFFSLKKHLYKNVRFQNNLKAKPIIDSIYFPIIVYLWSTSILIVVENFSWREVIGISYSILSIDKLNIAKNIAIVFWCWNRLVKQVEKLILNGVIKTKVNDLTTIQAFIKFFKAVFFIIIILCTLPVFDIPLSALLSFTGGSALAIGIASKDLLTNYLGGLMVHTDEKFKVGDWIMTIVNGKEVEGFIEIIGWRSTILRSIDKREVHIPNSTFLGAIVVNVSRMTNFRIHEKISLKHSNADIIQSITESITSYLITHTEIDTNQTTMATLSKITDYSFDIDIIAHTKTTDRKIFREVLQEILINSYQIITKLGGSLAVQTRYIESMDVCLPKSINIGVD